LWLEPFRFQGAFDMAGDNHVRMETERNLNLE
jgi:hypothetical protein